MTHDAMTLGQLVPYSHSFTFQGLKNAKLGIVIYAFNSNPPNKLAYLVVCSGPCVERIEEFDVDWSVLSTVLNDVAL